MEDYKAQSHEYQKQEKELEELMKILFISKARLQKLEKMEQAKQRKSKINKVETEKQEVILLDDMPKTDILTATSPKIKGGITNDLYEISEKSMGLLDTPKNKNQTESWLNDEIINGYIELVKTRQEVLSPSLSKEKVCYFNTYAYAKLEQLWAEDNIANFDRILRKKKIVNISDYDRLFFPVWFCDNN